ncbi:hypothetical protein [Piscibacillus salipiscarius]|nr:hypothetical protein [Piscibacillus salipiscarius]
MATDLEIRQIEEVLNKTEEAISNNEGSNASLI